MFEKIFSIFLEVLGTKSRLPLVLLSIGLLILFAPQPPTALVGDAVALVFLVIGYVAAGAGLLLLLLGLIEEQAGVPLAANATDGMLSGLVGMLVASSLSFAPNWGFVIEGDYFQRLWSPLPYGLAFGVILGLFGSIISLHSKIDVKKYFSMIAICYTASIFVLLNYVIMYSPTVQYKHFNLLDSWVLGLVSYPMYLILYRKGIRHVFTKKYLILFFSVKLSMLLFVFIFPADLFLDYYREGSGLYEVGFTGLHSRETRLFLIFIMIASLIHYAVLAYGMRTNDPSIEDERSPAS